MVGGGRGPTMNRGGEPQGRPAHTEYGLPAALAMPGAFKNGPSRSGPFVFLLPPCGGGRVGVLPGRSDPILGPDQFGASPSGKAADFGSAIPRFESWRPSHRLQPTSNVGSCRNPRCRMIASE